MKPSLFLSLALLLAGALFEPAIAQTREQGPWWPHPIWGAGDQAGGSNWITPEKVLEALALVQTGTVLELGHVYERGMPVLPDRSYEIFIPSFPTSGPVSDDRLVFNDEYVTAQIGQVGTQFDGLGHPGQRLTMADGTEADVFYNGFQGNDMKHPQGLQKLGIENVKPIITQGILIDVAGYKGVDILPESYEITLADVRSALQREGIDEADIRPGDALLFNLGWWRHWPDPHTISGNPAFLSQEVVDWVIEKQASMVGSDAALDGEVFRVHRDLVLRNGIFNLEFMNFESVLAAEVYRFLFVFTALRLKGATGSPGRPLAIY